MMITTMTIMTMIIMMMVIDLSFKDFKKIKMRNRFFGCIASLAIILFSCSEDAVDDIKPQIDLTIPDAAPVNCDTLWRKLYYEVEVY